jgi:hypothetical protein
MARVQPANRPMEYRVPSTFLPGSSAANSAKETALDVHTKPTAANTAASLDTSSPRALAPAIGARMADRLSRRRWATPCHRAVSQLSQLFSCVIVGPSAGNHFVDAVTIEPRQSLRDVPASP